MVKKTNKTLVVVDNEEKTVDRDKTEKRTSVRRHISIVRKSVTSFEKCQIDKKLWTDARWFSKISDFFFEICFLSFVFDLWSINLGLLVVRKAFVKP